MSVERAGEFSPRFEPALLHSGKIGELDRFQCDARFALSHSANRNDLAVFSEIEADERDFLPQHTHAFEAPEHFLNASQPRRGLLSFPVGIGERTVDAGLYGLASLHLFEQGFYRGRAT